MARARYEVRHAVAANVRDLLTGTISQTTGQTVWLPEAAYVSPGDLVGGEIFVYAGAGAGQSRRIATHVQDTANGVAQLTPFRPWDTAPIAGDSQVEIHLPQFDFTVAKLDEAIRGAVRAAEDSYLTDVTDETVTCQVGRNHYPIPPGFRSLHSVEEDFPADVGVPGSVYDSGALNWGSQFYDQDRPLNNTAASGRLSQSFYVTAGGQPHGYWSGGVALYLRTVGTPSPSLSLTVALERDAGGLPAGTLVDGLNGWSTVPVGRVSSTYAFVQFRWRAPIFLPSDLPVHVCLSNNLAPSGGAYVAWGEDTSTSYSRGLAAQHDGLAWTPIAGSALIFAVQTSQINERFRSIPRDDADGPRRRVVEDAGGGSLLWLRDPAEGARLRLRGQGLVAPPALDTDPVLVPEAYLVAKATSLVLAMQGSGPTMDADNRDRWALYHAQVAERELIRMRTQWRPNSEMVTPRAAP